MSRPSKTATRRGAIGDSLWLALRYFCTAPETPGAINFLLGGCVMYGSRQVCYSCWTEENPSRPPVRTSATPIQACHRCKRHTASGIYVRRKLTDDEVLRELAQLGQELQGDR